MDGSLKEVGISTETAHVKEVQIRSGIYSNIELYFNVVNNCVWHINVLSLTTQQIIVREKQNRYSVTEQSKVTKLVKIQHHVLSSLVL